MKTYVGIHGACGRMGQRLVALAHEDPAFQIVAAVDAATHPKQGTDAGELAGVGTIGVPISTTIPLGSRVDVVIDFSSPSGTLAILQCCLERKYPLVVATTGHEPHQRREIEAAAHEIPILLSPSMSLVVNLLFTLTRLTAEKLIGHGFDVEIVERHHRFKKDAPSGTALQFASIVQQVMKQQHIRHGREGMVGERPNDEIGMHAIRGGDSVGEHTIIFTTLGESLELVHKGTSRDSYARGALAAARFLAGQGAGMYSMADVLGL